MIEPIHSRIEANGLGHHVITWEPEAPRSDATVLCAHGFLDVGLSWRLTAERLVARGHRVVAFDWRGHGRSDWIGAGGYYYFIDYIADLADLVDALVPGPLHLVGHSMGGTACLLYAGTFPDRVERLVLMEGLGPPVPPEEPAPRRVARWISAMRRSRRRRAAPGPLPSVEAALERMRVQNPDLPYDLGLELAGEATRPTQTEHGPRITWAWDPMHRGPGPYPFRLQELAQFAEAITAPTLVVGGENGYRTPDHDARRSLLRNHREVVLPDVGHMMHWLDPDGVADTLHTFLTGPGGV